MIDVLIWVGNPKSGAGIIMTDLARMFLRFKDKYDLAVSVIVEGTNSLMDYKTMGFDEVFLVRPLPKRLYPYSQIFESYYVSRKLRGKEFDIFVHHLFGKLHGQFNVLHEGRNWRNFLDDAMFPTYYRVYFKPAIYYIINNNQRHDIVFSFRRESDKYFEQLGVDVIKHSNYVDVEIFRPRDICKKFDVIFVGRLVDVKNYKTLLKAVKDTNLKVLLVGSDSSYSRGNIHFLKWVSKEQLAILLNESKIFVLPSLYETFSLAGLEALAVGLPSIFSRNATPRELRDKVIILDNPLDYVELRHKIFDILDNYSYYHKRFLKIRRSIVKSYEKNSVLYREVELTLKKYINMFGHST